MVVRRHALLHLPRNVLEDMPVAPELLHADPAPVAAEMARMEDQADKIMGEDQDDYGKSDDSEDSKEPGTDAFLQVKRNIDDDNAQAAEMARMEDQADKIMGEDQDDYGKSDDSDD